MAPNHAEPQTLRLRNTRGGTVASSCFHHWTTKKPMSNRAQTTNNAMMRAFFHSYLLPPHCKASNKHMMPGKKSTVPRRSNFSSFCFHVASIFLPRRLSLKKKMMKAAVIAPKGRLIRKQSFHVYSSQHHTPHVILHRFIPLTT
jgi:hypothetical protein